MREYSEMVPVDQLQPGDLVDEKLGVAQVENITPHGVRIRYLEPRVRFSTPREYQEFDQRFQAHGDGYDGHVRVNLLSNLDLFQLGHRQILRRNITHRGRTRSNEVIRLDPAQAHWDRDFYRG